MRRQRDRRERLDVRSGGLQEPSSADAHCGTIRGTARDVGDLDLGAGVADAMTEIRMPKKRAHLEVTRGDTRDARQVIEHFPARREVRRLALECPGLIARGEHAIRLMELHEVVLVQPLPAPRLVLVDHDDAVPLLQVLRRRVQPVERGVSATHDAQVAVERL